MSYYWYASDLAQLLPQPVLGTPLVSATSRPVNASVFQTLIDLRSGEFDSAAAHAGYIVPIPTTAIGLAFVRLIVGMGARADALSQFGSDAKTAAQLLAAYETALNRIAAGQLPLNAPRDPGQTGRILPRWSGIASPQLSASMGRITFGLTTTDF